MKTVGLKVLKNKLSEYVRAAAAGETIVVTDRGRPVAEIVAAVRAGAGLTPFEAEGLREGWLKSALIREGTPPPRKAVSAITFERLMADLERDRADW